MRRILAFLLVFFVWLGVAQADVAVPPLRALVTDLTGTLSSADVAALDSRLKAYEREKGSQIAVLIVPTTQPEEIEQYSMRVVEQWKLGRSKVDDGILFLIAKNDRRMRIEVGYGLEGALPDITAKRIISDTVSPSFKAGDFVGGITAGVDAIIASIQGEPLPAPAVSNKADEDKVTHVFWFSALFGVVFAQVLRTALSDGIAVTLTALISGIIAWLFVPFLYAIGAAIIAFIFAFSAFKRGGIFYSGNGGLSGGGWSGGGGGGFGGGGASGGW